MNRYGTLGSTPVDRDAERLAHELFVERDPRLATPHRTAVTVLAHAFARLAHAMRQPSSGHRPERTILRPTH